MTFNIQKIVQVSYGDGTYSDPDRDKLLALKPTEIGRTKNLVWYEHPELGDDAPLLVYDPDHRVLGQSGEYDVPSLDELRDMMEYE